MATIKEATDNELKRMIEDIKREEERIELIRKNIRIYRKNLENYLGEKKKWKLTKVGYRL